MKTSDGETHELNAQQISDLASLQLEEMMVPKEKEEGSSSKPTEPSTEETVKQLHQRIARMEQTQANEKEVGKVNKIISSQLDKYGLTKKEGFWRENVRTLAYAAAAINSKINLETIIAKQVERAMTEKEREAELTKQRDVATTRVASGLFGLTSDGSGMPVISSEKEFKADDLQSGACQSALEDYLRGATS